MSENFKLDINIPQKQIEIMAKQVIRELIEEKIEIAMQNVDINKVINDKLNSIDVKLSKITKEIVNKKTNDLMWSVRQEIKDTARKVILEEIQKKPLTGNIYLRIDNSNVKTDYDDY